METQTEKKSVLKVTGTISWISDLITGTNQQGNQWTRRNFLLEVEDNGFKNTIGFQCWGSQAEIISRSKIGDGAVVYFTPISKMHDGKIYTELKAYGINLKFNV
jgi:hypothetical protein